MDTAGGPPFELEASHHEGWLVVRVRGDLDLATEPRLDALVAGQEGPVALDLSGVRFLDSSGLRGLVRMRDTAPAFALVAPSPPVLRILALTSLSDGFATVESADDLGPAG